MNSRVFPTLSILIAVSVFFAYVNPMWTGVIATARAAIALDDQALAAASEYTAQQNTLSSARAAIDSVDLDRLVTFLPDSVDNVGLILDLNALAARSGLSLANIDVVTNDSGTANAAMNAAVRGGPSSASAHPIGSVNLSLSAVGTFNALQTFLVGVERSARLLDVQDVVVRGSDTGVYAYQMTLRLYWLR